MKNNNPTVESSIADHIEVSAIRWKPGKWLLAGACILLVSVLGVNVYGTTLWTQGMAQVNEQLFYFMLAGFAAQLIDGALGMAYGISSNTFLVGLGLPPAVASASVHIAETFTTGVSGFSHLKFGNVNKKLFKSLVIPGVIGVVVGAYLLTSLDGKIVKPFVALYLFIMGVVILHRAFFTTIRKKKTKRLYPLAFLGGFLDSVGGGGWGPVVTSTLVNRGRDVRYTIGTVSLAEFFISLVGAGSFLLFVKISNWQAITGLIIGGVIAAPFAAYLCSRINPKYLMALVGIVIILLSGRTLFSVIS